MNLFFAFDLIKSAYGKIRVNLRFAAGESA